MSKRKKYDVFQFDDTLDVLLDVAFQLPIAFLFMYGIFWLGAKTEVYLIFFMVLIACAWVIDIVILVLFIKYMLKIQELEEKREEMKRKKKQNQLK